ncbi:MAG: GyrI-like domain-containing protein [Coprobacillaceae bacterium]
MENFDIKKIYKEQYGASSKRIDVVNVPAIKFIMVDGIGNPNVEEFKLKSKVLRLVFKEIKERKKQSGVICSTPPIEGIWDTYDNSHFDVSRKNMIKFTLMMALPDDVDEEMISQIKEELVASSDNPYIFDVYYKIYTEGKCVQLLHRGPYYTDINSTKKIMEFITVENMKLTGFHHEIYLNNADKVAEEDLKMIIRYAVEEA